MQLRVLNELSAYTKLAIPVAGPTGTGKTVLAAHNALAAMLTGNKVLIMGATQSTVENFGKTLDREIGKMPAAFREGWPAMEMMKLHGSNNELPFLKASQKASEPHANIQAISRDLASTLWRGLLGRTATFFKKYSSSIDDAKTRGLNLTQALHDTEKEANMDVSGALSTENEVNIRAGLKSKWHVLSKSAQQKQENGGNASELGNY